VPRVAPTTAEMVALPAPTPSTRPVGETDATRASLDSQRAVRPASVRPLESNERTFARSVSPTRRTVIGSTTDTETTIGSSGPVSPPRPQPVDSAAQHALAARTPSARVGPSGDRRAAIMRSKLSRSPARGK